MKGGAIRIILADRVLTVGALSEFEKYLGNITHICISLTSLH